MVPSSRLQTGLNEEANGVPSPSDATTSNNTKVDNPPAQSSPVQPSPAQSSPAQPNTGPESWQKQRLLERETITYLCGPLRGRKLFSTVSFSQDMRSGAEGRN